MTGLRAFSYTSLLVTGGATWLDSNAAIAATPAIDSLPPTTADIEADPAAAIIATAPDVSAATSAPDGPAPAPQLGPTAAMVAANPAISPEASTTPIVLSQPSALPTLTPPKQPLKQTAKPRSQLGIASAPVPEMQTTVPQFTHQSSDRGPITTPAPVASEAIATPSQPVVTRADALSVPEPQPVEPPSAETWPLAAPPLPDQPIRPESAEAASAKPTSSVNPERPDSSTGPLPTAVTSADLETLTLTEEAFPLEAVSSESPLPSMEPPEAAAEPQAQPTVAPAIAPEALTTAPSFSGGDSPTTTTPSTSANFEVFPIGINIGSRNVIESTLAKGAFDGETAIAFDQWLLPFDDLMQALRFSVTPLNDGDLELRSPGSVLRLSAADLETDPDLGLSLSVSDIQTVLGVPAAFDRLAYAIELSPPWGTANQRDRPRSEQPIITEGLPMVTPSNFQVTGVAQEFIASGSPDRGTRDSQAAFSGIGAAFGGSWFFDVNQPTPGDLSTWNLQEFQYLLPGDTRDIALGSQPTFWRSQQSNNDFWGASHIQRWGFEPEVPTGAGGFDPQERLRASEVGRSIVGEAEPGTLVQLTRGLSNVIIDEVLVDSSGLYRFDDIPVGGGVGRYEVRLFPNGQLTATPEVQPANFSIQAGQLPAGASALAISGGFNREADGFLGSFEDFRGGIAYRRGINETLTLGAGLVQDSTPQVLAEAFYVNDSFPMRAAVSALVDLPSGEIDVNADVRLRPSPSTQVSFRSDRFSQRVDASWAVSPNFTVTANADTRDEAVEVGTRFSFSGRDYYVLGNASIDTRNRLRWNLNSRAGAFGLNHYGDDITTQTQLLYNLSGNSAYDDGHSLLLDYETRNVDGSTNQLGAVSWRYRSEEQSVFGRPLWDVQVGYAVGSLGEGPIAQVSSAILPGVDLRLRYQAVSAVSGQDSFRIEVSPRLNLQNGVTLANERQEWLRTQGGLLVEPFFDEDGDGIRDADEPVYNDAENLDLLLAINHQPLNRFRPDIRNEGVFVNLPPGLYRVDLDPAGYPLDWNPTETAIVAEARPGQFTHLEIPLQESFTLTGVVTDEVGNPLGGQRVEAISNASGERVFSVTNAAGVFFLEGMSRGTYSFEVQNTAINDFEVVFDRDSENFQEMNFKVLSNNQILSSQ